MFDATVYIERRQTLAQQINSGLILFMGNNESPMNYPDNTYPFRQDSSFLYYFGLDCPGLAAVIDVDEDKVCVFGDDLTVDDIVWTGPLPTVQDRAREVGVNETATLGQLQTILTNAAAGGRAVRFLPQYRADNVLAIQRLLGICPSEIASRTSQTLTRAVIAQRSFKSDQEIEQIEWAVNLTGEMHTLAMKTARAGMYEREIAGAIEGLALSRGGRLTFPTIFSIHGETLHNHYHGNKMHAGDIVVNDSGAESPLGYAGDITRTIPIGGKFSARQKDIYAIVLEAQETAIQASAPGVEFRDVHRLACTILATGLTELGLMKGTPADAVDAGAHTLFFQCGLGHMMGLDVHDMEGLGEQYVGYTDQIERNPAFGWKSLRLAKALEPGFVITVEPGIYFIGELIDRWRADGKCADFINYDAVEQYRDFGGIRLEDDILITPGGHRVLGAPIPKSIKEVQALSSG
ncbi:MAG: aminopeptidase P family protein [Phycisphaerales bacterium]|jgi:Xaa-Pro aminopeptidase|nr:aminopeptidase P family protein [Phycisphaerales bacterium]